MSKTIQFRCPHCLKLLMKWETNSDKLIYLDKDVKFVDRMDSDKRKDIICPKCGTYCEVFTDGLKEVDLISGTPELPGPTKHIAIPA